MGIQKNVRAPMIDRVTIRRFKRFEEEVFHLKPFNLLIGPNNHGKTTLLQALSAWQLAYSTWRAARKMQPGPIKKNLRGVPIALPNFHSVPLTDFKHLWTGKRTQWFDQKEYGEFQKNKKRESRPRKKYQGKYTVEIIVHWKSVGEDQVSSDHHFGMAFLYDNEQSILVKPTLDTEELPHDTHSIVLTHIPPFSGLDAQEEYMADGAIRRRIGLSQPGSVVRNLLWRVFREDQEMWGELKKNVERYIGVQLQDPEFAEDIDPHIICQYVDSRGDSSEAFDLVNGGSGFHQLVTIFAILYWNKGTHLLLDEPDAHLHAWAQAGVLEFLKDMT
ncbi:MAG: AAA family ATPase, partial [Candidatus Latescibacteria bacterium]|nr:AAA family ATPase [Candidatus Latescibacterota bacterium]